MIDATTTKAPRKPKAATQPKPATVTRGVTTRAAKAPKPAKKPKPPKAPKPEPTATALKATALKAPSKIDQVVALLRREEGATTTALMEATGWQAHSVRGIIAGAIKKKLGVTVTSEAGEGGRTYRIVTSEASA